jgi:hypothetical protein
MIPNGSYCSYLENEVVMQVAEKLSVLIATTDDAADILGKCLAESVRSGKRGEVEAITRVAVEVLSLREFLQSNATLENASELQLVDPAKPNSEQPEGLDEVYTKGEEFAPYILLGFILLGGRAKFRDAQSVMYEAMKSDGAVRAIDERSTARTTRPRYLSNSTSHRNTMKRRGLIVKTEEGVDEISLAGRQAVEGWLTERGKNLEHYNIAVPSQLSDYYFHSETYAATLHLMGGRALQEEVARAYNRLIIAFPRIMKPGSNLALSSTHVESFQADRIIKVTSRGQVLLTTRGQSVASDWLRGCSVAEKELKEIAVRKTRRGKAKENQ